MSSQDVKVEAGQGGSQTLPDRTQDKAEGEISKNAAKKAAKQAKLAEGKGDKEAKKSVDKAGAAPKGSDTKAPKKKADGPALIGIDVKKEEDFPGWYQQVLTKGDMLDYYDVSGCFILKVRIRQSGWNFFFFFFFF